MKQILKNLIEQSAYRETPVIMGVCTTMFGRLWELTRTPAHTYKWKTLGCWAQHTLSDNSL